jgi:hypothetical protein
MTEKRQHGPPRRRSRVISAMASARGREGDGVDNVEVYFTDRGIEELQARRGDEEVTLAWLADRLEEFVDLNPEFEVPVERLATWLARLDDPDDPE